MKRRTKPRNPMAKELASPLYRGKKIRAKRAELRALEAQQEAEAARRGIDYPEED